METMKNQIRTLIRTSRLARIADEITALLRPGIRLERTALYKYPENVLAVDETSLALGASKLGGFPDLPSELEWPEYEGRPFSLVAQIRLAEVAPYDLAHELPPTGMLFFFYNYSSEDFPFFDEENEAYLRVIYYDGDLSRLRRRSVPVAEDVAEDLELVFNPCALTFSSQFTLPPLLSHEIHLLGLKPGHERNSPQRQDAEAYELLKERIEKLSLSPGFAEQEEAPSADRSPLHQLLGYSHPIHHFYDSSGNRLLLQMDADPKAYMSWGGTGILYFRISEEALAARDFSQVSVSAEVI